MLWRSLSRAAGPMMLLLSSFLLLPGGSSSFDVAILTDANFKATVENADDPLWLVEFYAPWCGHCKRLNPVLDEVAPLLGEKMRIGKVDATIQKRVADEHKVQAYPTLRFKRRGQPWVEYDGSRSKEALIAFAEKMNAPSPEVLTSAAQLKTLREQNEIVFLLVGPADEEAGPVEVAFKAVAEANKHSITTARATPDLVASEGELSGRPAPFIAKLEDGEAPVFFEGQPGQLKDWVDANSLPLLTAYAGHNFRRLGEMGKLMVIAVVDPSAEEKTEAFLSSIKEVGRSQRDLVAKHFVLGYLDGIRWDGFVRQFNIEKEDLPRFFVLDYAKQSFYEDAEVDEVDEIEHYLIDVAAGKVPAQRQGAMQATRRAWQRLKEWFPYSLVLLLPVALLLSTCLMPSLWADDSAPPGAKDDENEAEPRKEGEVTQGDAAQDSPQAASSATSKKDD